MWSLDWSSTSRTPSANKAMTKWLIKFHLTATSEVDEDAVMDFAWTILTEITDPRFGTFTSVSVGKEEEA